MGHRKQNLAGVKHRHKKWPTLMSSMYRNENVDVFNVSPENSMIFSIVIIIAI